MFYYFHNSDTEVLLNKSFVIIYITFVKIMLHILENFVI